MSTDDRTLYDALTARDARFDGVPDLSQPPVEPGGTFTYTLRFPDGGIYWYHPHVREDVQQDLGLSFDAEPLTGVRATPQDLSPFLAA